jgi:hypothetical protein
MLFATFDWNDDIKDEDVDSQEMYCPYWRKRIHKHVGFWRGSHKECIDVGGRIILKLMSE